MLATADHGAQFDPKVSGAIQVTPGQLQSDLPAAFPSETNTPVSQLVRNACIFVNEGAMKMSGYALEGISQFIFDYTKEQGAANPSTVSEAERGDRVFAAAFPSSVLPSLRCPPEARG